MAPFNLHGSNLKVETNVEGQMCDNDQWVASRANLEHNIGNLNKPLLEGLPNLVGEKPVQIEEDPDLLAANDADLRKRGVATPTRTRKPRTKKQ